MPSRAPGADWSYADLVTLLASRYAGLLVDTLLYRCTVVVSTYFGWSYLELRRFSLVVSLYSLLKQLQATVHPISQSRGSGYGGAAVRVPDQLVATLSGPTQSGQHLSLLSRRNLLPIKGPPTGFEMQYKVRSDSTWGNACKSVKVNVVGVRTRPYTSNRHCALSISGRPL